MMIRQVFYGAMSIGATFAIFAAFEHRWPTWVLLPLLVAACFSNYVAGYERAQSMMRRVWKLPR
jgi:hypothetical protein